MAKYPKRESHFAHKLVRLMIRCCAAQEIGTDGFLLVTVIVHTEDAKRYSGPVTFWNDQLVSVLGFASWGKLDRARKKAVAGGWLHYEPGRKGTVGKYWTTVPRDLEDMPDTPVDCDYPHVFLSNSEEENGGETGEKRGRNGGETGEKRGRSGEHSTLTLIPSPIPSISSEPSAKASEPPVMVFPVVGKDATEWALEATFIQELQAAYPGIEVKAECAKARAWCLANPTKRKTARGMTRFLNGWMERAQNAARAGPAPARPARPTLTREQREEEMRRYDAEHGGASDET